jgi:hypothetical protein
VRLSRGSPIVESSAIDPRQLFPRFNDLRLETQLPSEVHPMNTLLSGSHMLRITRTANGDTVFRISGELDGVNVAEVDAVIAAEIEGTRVVLDLTDLRSVDGEAVKSLEKWEADSIKLKNCAPYIREWIRRLRVERLEKSQRRNSGNGTS